MGDEEKFVVDLDQPGIGDGVKLGVKCPKEFLEKLWVDPHFPLDYTSIGIPKEEAMSVAGRMLDYVWCPITYCHPGKPLFPEDGMIDPATLMQGALGDCWLISAISTMAEYPDSIRNLFITKEHNEIGQYVVRLWSQELSSWVRVKVDSFMPLDTGGGVAYEGKPLIYVNPCDDAVWMCVLEKAFAKIWGNYMQLNGGLVSDGWKVMTGASEGEIENWHLGSNGWGKRYSAFDVQDLDVEWDDETKSFHNPDQELGPYTPEEFFKCLQSWDSKKYLMCAGIIAKKNPNIKEDVEGEAEGDLGNGLVTKHTYGVLGSYEGHGLELVRVRNPWGKKQEYDGDWGDSSEKWKEHPEVAKEVNFQKRVDGVFWMTIADFCKWFTMLQVLKKSQPGERAVDSPYEEKRAEKVKKARERAQRIRRELYDNGGWYTDEAVSWRGDKMPNMRVFQDPDLFDIVTKAYMEHWGIPENNAKDFAEHARTKLPPKIERLLANRTKAKSKREETPQWMKGEVCGSLPPGPDSTGPPDSTSPTAAGSGLGAVRALQKEAAEAEPDPLAEARAEALRKDREAIAKIRAEMAARQAGQDAEAGKEKESTPIDDEGRYAALLEAEKKGLSQADKWAAMGMF
ncbi:DEK1 [Symbiodinium sp. CCMP2592]|nr:DEK1 [Symbiodinium sp. CCMP2592]